jgi:HAD superfamily hydrolase (TIGR01490 family)
VSPSRAAAFFDVDETLIAVKSMFDFLDFYLGNRVSEHDTGRASRVAAFRAAARDRRVPREEVNRVYYRIYAGERADTLAELGRTWFRTRRREPGFVLAPVVAALVRHRLAGHRVVLVSGSMPACLDPLADALGADDVLCTRPVVDDAGLLTGGIVASLIGEGKRLAVRALAAERGLSLPLSFGYADHTSDLPMLTLLGHPVVVGAEPALVAHAERHGWLRFPAPGAALAEVAA